MHTLKRMLATAVAVAALGSSDAMASDTAAKFQTDFLAGKLDWSAVLAAAKAEGKVQFYYWGGDDRLNVWIDSVVVPALAKDGVEVKANRITDTKDAVDLVLAEANSGRKIGDGSVDMIWLNGDNFYTLSKQNLLFGSFAQSLPNSKNFDWDASDPRSLLNFRDFGVETGMQEVPWSGEQYVCAANRALLPVDKTPHTFDDLKSYLTANPGKFTYVKPPQFIGHTFVQEALYAFNPDKNGAEPFQKSATDLGPKEIARLITPGMEYLKSLEPLLLGGQNGGTARHPETPDEAQGMFRNGEIAINCGFGLYAVATNRSTGAYPDTAEEIVFPEKLMIKNKNYLAIPSNAPDPAAALVLANYMSSVESQASKLKTIGYPAGIDAWLLSSDDAKTLDDAAPKHFGVTQADLDANIAPDTNASLVNIIKATWLEYIERKSDLPLDQIVANAYAAVTK
jgi:putative spermidine/putrescine transport system substrate-binding protein